ncbi:MAG: YHS domain protein [Cytophagales bacterium]|nr:YHS domain protein [Cytophaga sp.]
MKQLLITLLIGICANVMFVSAQNDAARLKQFNVEKVLAIKGFDPVSYYSGKPMKGSSTHTFTYKSIVYRFASQANLDTFKTNPAMYEPAYGGWCAFAMGDSGEKIEVDPMTYKIINGKVYLFYNFYFNNTLTDWNKDEANLLKKANINWAKFYTN